MSWTDERVEVLKTLWTEGLSASQIADRLGGVSRNAVIGKVHRLKLESRARAPVAEPEPQQQQQQVAPAAVAEVETVEVVVPARLVASQAQPSVVSRSMPRSIGATALKMEPDLEDVEIEETEEEVEAGQEMGEVVPISRKLALVQLTENTCKWPMGDPLKPDFHFCGNSARDASPYCAYHAKLAFQPASERRRSR